jgi:hypothetical protein
MTGVPIITFGFRGGDADAGQLNFYDASRFQYGAARLLYTLEHYRQTRRVLGRITTQVRVDFRVETPRDGSWCLDVLQAAAVPIAEVLIKVPIDVLTAYVVGNLTSSKKPADIALEIEKERTKQSERETKRSEQETERLRLFAQNQQVPLRILQEELARKERPSEELRNIEESIQELKCSIERQTTMAEYQKELDRITQTEQTQLIQRVHGQLTEIGRPLIASAEELRIEGRSFAHPFAYMNRKHVESLSGNIEDDLPTVLRGSITRYDKENGWGRFRHPDARRPISFVIPGAVRNVLSHEIIDAMKEKEVLLSFYYVKDKRGVVKYMILDKIVEEDIFG